ncbi:DUF4350 domain-containing protein [Nocardiopsis sp. FIRDI 009]|uniref:DUF4350 domain-containing protein n=1 Tax=Nocardiopsis sp. FIRDI 009 TaxID=714197 RepID=UPI000E27FE77|nr:DUF4350 domain-containing protein [Nocardiopsis sp. FIRDI 009]
MTAPAPTVSPAPAAPRPGSADPRGGGPARLWRSVRVPLLLFTVFVVVVVLLSLGAERFPEGYLEPESVSPDGTRALVRLLEEDGEVEIARSSSDAADAVSDAGDDVVLLVSLDHRLLPEEVERLADLDVDTVLVQPSLTTLSAFAPGVDVTGRIDEGAALVPSCDLPGAAAAGEAGVGGELYTAAGDADAMGCYPSATGDALLRVTGDGATTTVLGTGHPLTNGALAGHGNAALALNLLAADEVVWLRPDTPQVGGGSSLWELLPSGVRWSVVPLVATLGLLAVWRGRRMGALVPEALPVVVRAAETTEGRAGLYQSHRARDRAADALRRGFRERAAPKLGLDPDASPEAVVAAVAARTGDDAVRLRGVIYGDRPDPFTADDRSLVRLADELDERTRKLR